MFKKDIGEKMLYSVKQLFHLTTQLQGNPALYMRIVTVSIHKVICYVTAWHNNTHLLQLPLQSDVRRKQLESQLLLLWEAPPNN